MFDSVARFLISCQMLHSPLNCRRKLILSKHPSVKNLFGVDRSTLYKVLFGVILQLVSLHLLQDSSWFTWFFCCYTLSGSINHGMTLAIHEMSHNLASKSLLNNKLFMIVANLPMGIPAAISFKRYHAEHHKYLGEYHVDVDIPTTQEGEFFGTSPPAKMLALLLTPLSYSIRPLILDPREPLLWEHINITCCVLFDLVIWYCYGLKGLAYLILGTLLGMGIHPCAGHFIAEHYVFSREQETFSYYGPMNWISYNCGYHVEHHDLPRVPCKHLSELRKVAPEFYNTLPNYHSWCKVLYDYVVDSKLSSYSRIVRVTATQQEVSALRARGGLVKCDKF